MHIALVHHHVGGKAGGGGGVRLMLELGTGLVRRGHRVTVACHDYLPGSEFSYAADQLEIRSVRRRPSCPPATARWPAASGSTCRRSPGSCPPDADVVNAHEWLALRPGASPPGACRSRSCGRATTRSPWEALLAPSQTITGDRPLPVRAARAALTWPDLLDARRASAIAVLSAQQVEMVRRSYRKDALVVPVGPPAHFFDPPDRAAARARLGIPEDVFLVVGSGILVEHRRFEDLIDGDVAAGRRSPSTR